MIHRHITLVVVQRSYKLSVLERLFIHISLELCVGRSTSNCTVEQLVSYHPYRELNEADEGIMEVQTEETSLRYLNHPQEILRALMDSKENGNVIGIFALSLGPIMIMTAVDDIVEIKNDYLIVLKEQDLLGIPVPEEQIFLKEIVRVHPFKTLYNDPFHVRLRQAKHVGS